MKLAADAGLTYIRLETAYPKFPVFGSFCPNGVVNGARFLRVSSLGAGAL